MTQYVLKNKLPNMLWLLLPNPEEEGRLNRGVRVPPRGTIVLNEEEYNSMDVQAKIREGVLVLLETR